MDNNFNFSHTSNTVSVLGPKFFHFPEKSNSLIKIRNYFETTIPKTFNSKNSSINIPKHEIFPRNIHFSLSLSFFSKKRSEKKPRKIFQTPTIFPNIIYLRIYSIFARNSPISRRSHQGMNLPPSRERNSPPLVLLAFPRIVDQDTRSHPPCLKFHRAEKRGEGNVFSGSRGLRLVWARDKRGRRWRRRGGLLLKNSNPF